MELKLEKLTFPEVIEFNFDELKQEIEERSAKFVNLIYSEDQIKSAKADVAALRKFTKALSDERIKVKKQILKPYTDFEEKIKILDGIVGVAISNIDGQIRNYDDREKADKLVAIEGYWTACEKPFEISLEMIMDQKWLNKSVSLKNVYKAIDEKLVDINSDLSTLQNLPEFAFEATEVYKTSLDLGKAIQEGHRLSEIQKRKAEAELKKQEAPETVKMPDGGVYVQDQDKQGFTHHENPVHREPICFRAYLTPEDALALRDFMESRGIPFEAI